ncbi:hypothetical protein [Actinoallomurus sp. CA-150999]|uniref:hypothetical protein n=1 Tax=Actinoallomurus sp. CA-150999 TaxID=3239887 RepID=UPI003D8F9C27
MILFATAAAAQPSVFTGHRAGPRRGASARTVAPVTGEALIRLRSAEVARSLKRVEGRIRTLRNARRELTGLPAARRTPAVLAALAQLGRQQESLDRLATALRRRTAEATDRSRRPAERARLASALADVEGALTELRGLPPDSRTPYLRAAVSRLAERRTVLRRRLSAADRAIARLDEELSAPLPAGAP